MAITSKKLTTTGDDDVYTSSGRNAVVTIMICNIGNPDPTGVDESINAATLTLNVTSAAPNNVSTDANTVVKNLLVPAGETVIFSDEKLVLENGNQIRATASVSNLICITVSTLTV